MICLFNLSDLIDNTENIIDGLFWSKVSVKYRLTSCQKMLGNLWIGAILITLDGHRVMVVDYGSIVHDGDYKYVLFKLLV